MLRLSYLICQINKGCLCVCLRVCVCVCLCLCTSCTSVESEGDQTVSQLPWEGSSGCDRVEEAKYPGSNTLLCLSHNEAASPGSDNNTHTECSNTGHGLDAGLKLRHDPSREHGRGAFTTETLFLYLPFCCITVKLHHGAPCVSERVSVCVSGCVCVSSPQGYSRHHSTCGNNLC